MNKQVVIPDLLANAVRLVQQNQNFRLKVPQKDKRPTPGK